MDRRKFLGTAAGAALGMGLLGPASLIRGAGRPNVVFILTDDHRYDAFGFMDRPWLNTPAMDRVAAEGVHFANSFVTTSLCSPSRASFLTGRWAGSHGVRDTHTPLPDDCTTFLEILHGAGYHTGFIGKWHMSGKGIPDLSGQGKVDRMVSFDVNFGQGIYFDCPLIVDGVETDHPGYITDVLTDYAIDFLEKRGGKPFCLYLSHKAVHDDFQPPGRYRGQLEDKVPPKEHFPSKTYPIAPVQQKQMADFDRNRRMYYEALMGVDDSVARVLEYLDDHGLAENTLLVYAGDNGFMWGEHGLIDKRYAFEESIRIPHLLRFPRLIPEGGRRIEEMVLNVDLMPTILAATGLEGPRAIQGSAYLGLCRGENQVWRSDWLYEYFGDIGFPQPPIRAVRTEEWKLVAYGKSPMQVKDFPDELYHLADDPGEQINLIDDPEYDPVKKELYHRLKMLVKESSRRD